MKTKAICLAVVLGWVFSCNEAKPPPDLVHKKNSIWAVRCDTNWYENGKIKRIQNYSMGKLNGKQLYFSRSGCILSEENYAHGEKHGIFISCIKTKKLFKVCKFVHNVKHGAQVIVDMENNRVSSCLYNWGSPVRTGESHISKQVEHLVNYLKACLFAQTGRVRVKV